MEQSNNFNNTGGGKGPKMPRFNMNWLYTIILIALIALFFSGGGDAFGGSAAQGDPPTPLKQNVDTGEGVGGVAQKKGRNPQIKIKPPFKGHHGKVTGQTHPERESAREGKRGDLGG